MKSNTLLRLFFMLVMLAAFIDFYKNACAELVLIRSRSGAEGQGWLFGAPQNGQSWIVTPAHVVASRETGELEPFYFIDSHGVSGESARPISGIAFTHSATADREAYDLAFARVVVGRPDGSCLSRLGLSSYGYQAAMMRTQGFNVISRFLTSSGTLPVMLARHSVDSFGGAVIDFKIVGDVAQDTMRKGMSGSIVVAEIGGQNEPMAMVLEVDTARNVLRTMRFDYIKNSFNAVSSKKNTAFSGTESLSNIPYSVLYTSYVPGNGDHGTASLQQADGCWKALPLEGKKTADIVIAINEHGKTIDKIIIAQAPWCGSGSVQFWVDQRVNENENWEYATMCRAVDHNSTGCRIGLSSPRQLRLRFNARDSISIHGILLQ